MERWARIAIASIASLVTACGGEPDGDVTAAPSPPHALPRIVGGAPSPAAEDAIVRLEIGGAGTCSGTLVAPSLVLTARHCLARIEAGPGCGSFGSELTPSTISVYTGQAGQTLAARGSQIFAEHETDACAHDIGLLLLDRALTGVTPASVRTTTLAPGAIVTASGYGEDGHGQSPPVRLDRGGLVVVAVGPTPYTWITKSGHAIAFDVPAGDVVTGESTCFGDSGGPLLDGSGAVAAVTSRGVDGVCVDRPTIYTALAAHADLVRTAIDATTRGVESVVAARPAETADAGADAEPDAPPIARPRPAIPARAGCTTAPSAASRSGAGTFACAAIALAALLRARRRSIARGP